VSPARAVSTYVLTACSVGTAVSESSMRVPSVENSSITTVPGGNVRVVNSPVLGLNPPIGPGSCSIYT